MSKRKTGKTRKTNIQEKTLHEFYTPEQKKREQIEEIEQQIFEHLKAHTHKILKKR